MNMPKERKMILFLLAICLLLTAVTAFFSFRIQRRLTLEDAENDLSCQLDGITENYQASLPLKEKTEESNHQTYQSYVRTAAGILSRNGEEEISEGTLREICHDLGFSNLLVIDRDGNLLEGAYSVNADLTLDRFNELRHCLVTGEASGGFSVRLDEEENYYYGYPLDGERIVVLTAPSEELRAINEEAFGWSNLLANANPGIEGFTMVTNPHTNRIIWAEDSRLIGENQLQLIVNKGITVDQESFYKTCILGKQYYTLARYFREADVSFNISIPAEEMNRLIFAPVISVSLLFFLGAFVLSWFILICRREDRNRNTRDLVRKSMPVTVVVLVLLIAATCFIQTLCSLSVRMMRNETYASNIRGTIRKYETTQQKITERSDSSTTKMAEEAAYMITKFPELMTREGLENLADMIGCKEIRIYDTDGRTVTSSHGKDGFSLSEDPGSQSYEFRRLLRGTASYCQIPMANENGDFHQYAGVALWDENGDNKGFVQVDTIPYQVINASKVFSVEAVLSSFTATDGTFALESDKEEKRILWSPWENLTGKSALDYGLRELNFRDNFNGYLTVNGTKCFASCAETENSFLFVATPQRDVFAGRGRNVTLYSVLFAVMLFALCGIIIPTLIKTEKTEQGNAQKESPEITETPLSLLLSGRLRASDSDKKLFAMLRTAFIVFSLLISLLYAGRDMILDESSIIRYIFDGRWESGVNAFSITACLTLICVVYMSVLLIRKLLDFLSRALNARGETICRLAGNFISVFSVFACIYFCLSYVGVDTSTLLASAGIMSIVVGLGANKLISDILAGLAIVFDGSIQVGDFISSADYTGFVREIGIRSTKLKDLENRIIVVPNSELGGIINSSVPDYKINILIWVGYSEPLEKIRRILDEERDSIRSRNPEIREGPYIDGVTEVGSAGYEVRFSMICDGNDFGKLTITMRNELREMLVRHGVERSIEYQIQPSLDPSDIREVLAPAMKD